MSVIKKGASAFGKLFVLIALAATFLTGMVGVVYMSLQGDEIKVPEVVGKDLNAGEQELAALGLRIKKRAARPSAEKMNTILEQLPKAGDTVKTGQMILVVISEAGASGEEIPAATRKTSDEDDTEKIEELISDKPKKSNKRDANANSGKKKTSTTRDVLSNNSNGSNSNSTNSNASSGNSSKENKNSSTDSNKNASPSDAKKPAIDAKPAVAKTPVKPAAGGDVRPKKTP